MISESPNLNARQSASQQMLDVPTDPKVRLNIAWDLFSQAIVADEQSCRNLAARSMKEALIVSMLTSDPGHLAEVSLIRSLLMNAGLMPAVDEARDRVRYSVLRLAHDVVAAEPSE